MPTADKQLSPEQSRQVAETIREEIARRRISRQTLANKPNSAFRPWKKSWAADARSPLQPRFD